MFTLIKIHKISIKGWLSITLGYSAFLFSVLSFSTFGQTADLPTYWGKSYALVIGIEKYPARQWHNLPKAADDAIKIGNYLKSQGFEVTQLLNEEATSENILTTLETTIARKLKKNDRLVVYFSGHGHTETIDGEDYGYLVPYDGRSIGSYIGMERIASISQKLRRARHQLFLMDACYSGLTLLKGRSDDSQFIHPNYIQSLSSKASRLVLTAGSKDERVLDGHFARVFLDGVNGEADYDNNGYVNYSELKQYILRVGTNHLQTPGGFELPGHNTGEFVFLSPNSIILNKTAVDNPRNQPSSSADTDVKKGREDDSNTKPNKISVSVNTNGRKPGTVFQDTLKDGSLGPKMVVIPAGEFLMGSPESEINRLDSEGPQHKVSIQQFSMMQTEVTVQQYRQFIETTGYIAKGTCTAWSVGKSEVGNARNWLNPGFNQGPTEPVTCVSWYDATAYANWLSEETGKNYRLPTEAEWEYAARAGSHTRFSFGDDLNQICRYGNGADRSAKRKFKWSWTYSCNDGFSYTAPVASFRANAFGLYDMHGNVWEWTQDHYYKNYDGAPIDGRARVSSSWAARVLRGGSWDFSGLYLRTSARLGSVPNDRGSSLGLRLSRGS